MEIYKAIVDNKPANRIACPLMHLRSCGKQTLYKGNGSAAYGKCPDNRCYIREKSESMSTYQEFMIIISIVMMIIAILNYIKDKKIVTHPCKEK